MKICFPVEKDKGIESGVYGHFGSAPGFVVYDTEAEKADFIDNSDINHVHGACNPAAALAGREVDMVVVGGIGQGALLRLMQSGIQVARSGEGSVAENLELFKNGKLEVLSPDMQTCSHGTHNCSH